MRKLIKLAPIGLASTVLTVSPLFAIAGNKTVTAINKTFTIRDSVNSEDIDNPTIRFNRDVSLHHAQYVQEFKDWYISQPKSSTFQPWGSMIGENGVTDSHGKDSGKWEGRDNWKSRSGLSTQNFGTKDIYGVEFDSPNSKPRIISNQGSFAPNALIQGVNNVGDFYDSSNDDNGLQPWHHCIAMNNFAEGGHRVAYQNFQLNELFETKRENRNKMFDIVNLKFQIMQDGIPNRHIHIGEKYWKKNDDVFNREHNGLLNYINGEGNKSYIGNCFHIKSGQYFMGQASAIWFYQLQNNYLNLDFIMFGLDNMLKVNDFGYDSEGGYWYTIGLNNDFLSAAEGEKYNPYTLQQWQSEIDSIGNRILWIPASEDLPEQPAGTYEAQRDAVFSLIQDYIDKRIITYDNYLTIRKWVHDKCALNKQIINLETIKDEIDQNPELQNTGWTYFSDKYGIIGCPNLWDSMVLILPSINYTIQHAYNAQEDARGAWGTLIKQEPMSFYQLTSKSNKVYVGDPGPEKGYAFQANCNILHGDQSSDAPFSIDTWDSQYTIDKDGQKTDADINLTSYSKDELNFIFRNTLQIPIDPQQHSGERSVDETYFHVGPNFEKLCAVEYEKNLHITADKENTPSVAWNIAKQQGSSIEEHIMSMVADEEGNPSPLFAYKKLDGSLDANLSDEMLQVVPHNREGTIEVRLFDPENEYVVASTNLTGFKKDDSGANINFNFKTPYSMTTNKTSETLSVDMECSITGAYLTYEVKDPSLLDVIDTTEFGTKFKLKTKEQLGNALVIAKLWYPDGITLIDQASFIVNISPSPESVEITSHPELVQEVDEDRFSEGYLETPFEAQVHPKEAGNVKWLLYPANNEPLPEWLHIGSDNGYIYWTNAQKGSYSFYVVADSVVDKNVYTSEIMTLSFGIPPIPPSPHKANIPAIVGGTVGGVAVAGSGTGFGIFAYRRRKGPSTRHSKGGK